MAKTRDRCSRRWYFDPDIQLSHAVWQAMHDQNEVQVMNGGNWTHDTLAGENRVLGPKIDSFSYKDNSGLRSVILDDDLCACRAVLVMGQAVCYNETSRSDLVNVEFPYGVAPLTSEHCDVDDNLALTLYFYEDQRERLSQGEDPEQPNTHEVAPMVEEESFAASTVPARSGQNPSTRKDGQSVIATGTKFAGGVRTSTLRRAATAGAPRNVPPTSLRAQKKRKQGLADHRVRGQIHG
ncbi:PREDICTED: uncharacterized protein LOC106820718 [Priapulus caudatus]|uniref:Uncharacterized protein LOC106820718 n=1 Tax=Priapulus caudatus TaxID=37621 RepID=A0ABM1F8E2_PRICU|nr:PREDICTED: uncharacterized protein LOC106820718 [Priapulus caudatus]